MTRSQLLRGGVGLAVVATVAAVFWRTLSANWDAIRDTDVSPDWWMLGVLACFVLAVAVSGFLWGRIVSRLDNKRLGATEAIRVHFMSWLLKYIPGQVGFVVNKVMWGKRRGTSRLLVLLSVIYENAFLLIGSTVPMLAILVTAQALRGEHIAITTHAWIALAAIVPVFAVAHRGLFSLAMNALAKRTLKRPVPDEYFLSGGTAVRFQLAFLLPRVINGIGIGLTAAALSGASAGSWIPLGAAYALAGAVGILAVFVPSGLGVRESVFVVFAAPLLGVEQAIVVSLVARVLSTVGDAVIAAIVGVLRFVPQREGQQS